MKHAVLRKLFAVVSAAVLLCTIPSLQIFAETPGALYDYAVYNDFQSGDYAVLTAYKGSETDLILPDTIEGYTVKQLDSSLIQNKDTCGIKTITIPASVEMIFDGAITDIPTLESCFVEDGNQYYSSLDGVLFNQRDGVLTLMLYPASKTATHYTVPDGVTIIGTSAFSQCTSLQSVSLPEGVYALAGYAFSGCTSLDSVKLPRALKMVMLYAFKNCTSLKTVYFSSSVPNSEQVSLSHYAFSGCTALEQVYLPNQNYDFGFEVFPPIENLTIYGLSGGNTEDYAKANSIAFVNTKIYLEESYQNNKVFCAFSQTPTYLIVEALEDRYSSYYAPLSIEVLDENGNAITDLIPPAKPGTTFYITSEKMDAQFCYVLVEIQCGDVNMDGKITAVDARHALQAASGIRELTASATKAADVNQDGLVTAVDARHILQAASGIRKLENFS